MKTYGSSDSLTAFMSLCPTSEGESGRNGDAYGRELDSMIEECLVGEKKRRLAVNQVKALEKTFEIENKLEPDRKLKLAQELGLHPRQVAVWFQNRRARSKTNQLQTDYSLLKANYQTLNHTFHSLQQDNHSLLKQIQELKSNLRDGNTDTNLLIQQTDFISLPLASDHSDHFIGGEKQRLEASFPDFKDGSSDSDSSAVLNDDNTSNAVVSSAAPAIHQSHHQILSSPINNAQQFVKIEEYNFFSGEETCNLFADEEAPSLPWYNSDQWN